MAAVRLDLRHVIHIGGWDDPDLPMDVIRDIVRTGGDGHIVLWRQIRRRIEAGRPPHGVALLASPVGDPTNPVGVIGAATDHPEMPGRVFIVVRRGYRHRGYGTDLRRALEAVWNPAVGLQAVVAATNAASLRLFAPWQTVGRSGDRIVLAWPARPGESAP